MIFLAFLINKFIRDLLVELGFTLPGPSPIYSDSKSAIDMSRGGASVGRRVPRVRRRGRGGGTRVVPVVRARSCNLASKLLGYGVGRYESFAVGQGDDAVDDEGEQVRLALAVVPQIE